MSKLVTVKYPLKRHWMDVGVFTAILLLFLYGIDHNSLWNDEFTTEKIVSYSWSELFDYVFYGLYHPPLYLILEKIWVSGFGNSEFALRFPSAVYASLGILALYKLVQKMGMNRRSQVSVVLLLISCPSIFYYAQEARPYALVFMLASFFQYQRMNLLHNRDFKSSVVYLVLAALLIQAHYFTILFLFPILVFDWVGSLRELAKKRNFQIIASLVVIVIFFQFEKLAQSYSGVSAKYNWLSARNYGIKDLVRGNIGLPYCVHHLGLGRLFFELSLIAIALLGVLRLKNPTAVSDRSLWVGLALGAFVPFIGALILRQMGVNVMMDRYFIYAHVGFWLLILLFLESPKIGPRMASLVIAVIVSMQLWNLVFTEQYFSRSLKEDWRQVVLDLSRDPDLSSSVVVYCQWDSYYAYYTQRIPMNELGHFTKCKFGPEAYRWALKEFPSAKRVFLVYGGRQFQSSIAKRWKLDHEAHYNGAGYYKLTPLKTLIKP